MTDLSPGNGAMRSRFDGWRTGSAPAGPVVALADELISRGIPLEDADRIVAAAFKLGFDDAVDFIESAAGGPKRGLD